MKDTCWTIFKVILCIWLFYVYFLRGDSSVGKQDTHFSLTKTAIFRHDAYSQILKVPYYFNDVGVKQAQTNPQYKKMVISRALQSVD